MKVGRRGQVTIPKTIRDRFGIGPGTEVEFVVEQGEIVLRKRAPPLLLRNWVGYCGSADVDVYVDEVRGVFRS